jgi:hypothetical protein
MDKNNSTISAEATKVIPFNEAGLASIRSYAEETGKSYEDALAEVTDDYNKGLVNESGEPTAAGNSEAQKELEGLGEALEEVLGGSGDSAGDDFEGLSDSLDDTDKEEEN